MSRHSRHNSVVPASGRPVPPLPHPSWTHGSSLHGEGSARIAPEEFWKRLGI